jgi:hypothetical protein
VKNIIIVTTILFLLSCNDPEKTGNKSLMVNEQKAVLVSKSFLDSVEKQYDLSFQQIAKYTTIDSAYWTFHPEASFEGDTVWNLENGIKAALINYSDALVCSHIFIAVFLPDSLRSTDVKRIREDCDRDLSYWHESLDFTLPSGSRFETLEKHYPPEDDEDKYDKDSIITHKWIINSRGKIDTLR